MTFAKFGLSQVQGNNAAAYDITDNGTNVRKEIIKDNFIFYCLNPGY